MSIILHISDLHLSNDETWQNLEIIERSLIGDLRESPGLIVVSGDFTDHPEGGLVARTKAAFSRRPARGLGEIKAALERLRLRCGEKCALVVVPGNHDYREFGLVGSSRSCAAFDKIFGDWKSTTTLRMDGRLVIVFKLDSNTNDPRINAARGRVGNKELLRFRGEFDRVKASAGQEFASALKIMVLHHHPLPIADMAQTGYFGTDGFLGLDDSGIFLREMATRQIDIVLHGHKHQAFNSRIEVNVDTVRRGLAVIAAGSACKDTEPEKSVNIIHVGRRAISAEVRRRNAGLEFSTIENFPIVSYDRYLARAFEDFIADKGVGYYSDLIHIVQSINGSGDCDIVTQYHRLKATGHGPSDILVDSSCPHGTFSRYSWSMTTPHASQLIFTRDAIDDPGALRGTVRFQPALRPRTDSVNVEERVRLYNSFAMDQEQRARVDAKATSEHIGIGIVRPTAELTFAAHFVETELPDDIDIRSYARDVQSEEDDLEETERCSLNLRICRLNRTISLTLSKPLRGCTYFIEWRLPDAPARRYALVDRGRCNLIMSRLLSLNVNDLSQNPLTRTFEEEATRLAQEYDTPRADIEVGLMVFDPQIKRLRFVAGELRKDTWGYQLYEGQGIAGRAHKIDRTLICVPSRVNPNTDFMAQPPPKGSMPEIIICIPIRYPLSTPEGVGATVAVLAIATYYSASNLLKLADDDNAAKAITIESQITFCEEIMPKLVFENWGKPSKLDQG